jgi:hypothetical protein
MDLQMTPELVNTIQRPSSESLPPLPTTSTGRSRGVTRWRPFPSAFTTRWNRQWTHQPRGGCPTPRRRRPGEVPGFQPLRSGLDLAGKVCDLGTRWWRTVVVYALTSLTHAQASPARLAIAVLHAHGDRNIAAAVGRNARDAARVLPLLGITSP